MQEKEIIFVLLHHKTAIMQRLATFSFLGIVIFLLCFAQFGSGAKQAGGRTGAKAGAEAGVSLTSVRAAAPEVRPVRQL